LGQKIRVRQAEQEFEALALDVTEEGFLVVQRGHLRQVLAAGEVSLKLEHGG
jgi:biotin-(acetyl-CoA carboxylase) ligase